MAASMLTAVYNMLKDHVPYHDLGGEYFDRRDKSIISRRLINKLNTLGFHVEVSRRRESISLKSSVKLELKNKVVV